MRICRVPTRPKKRIWEEIHFLGPSVSSGRTVWSILRRADFSSDSDHYGISGSEEESELFGDVVARESVVP